ncbi:MAG: acyltransferase domain-containing protein [Spirochaetales bacterium]|nr:acyltransferase domain-containing protein [Spirochaetales bacterium]
MDNFVGLFPPHGGLSAKQLDNILSQMGNRDSSLQTLEGLLGCSLREDTSQRKELLSDGLHGQALSMALSCDFYGFLQERGISFDYVIGHSLGVYSALVATGSLKIEEGLKLFLGHLELVRDCPGGMAAIINLPWEKVHSYCEKQKDVWITVYNSRKLCLVSGSDDGLVKLDQWMDSQEGFMRIMEGYGPWHCPLAQPSLEKAQLMIEEIPWKEPEVPLLIPFETSRTVTTKEELKDLLLEHVTSSVFWQKNVEPLLQNQDTRCFEVGLTGTLNKFYKYDSLLQENLISMGLGERWEDFADKLETGTHSDPAVRLSWGKQSPSPARNPGPRPQKNRRPPDSP